MKLLVLSDTHLGHPGWHGFGDQAWASAVELSRTQQIDVLLFCGDLCEPGRILQAEGLKLMSQVVATKKLWVAGNNDIEWALRQGATIKSYAGWLHSLAHPHGVQVLDAFPATWGGFTFVGGFGFYDWSLWRKPSSPSPNYPSDREALVRESNAWHQKEMGVTVPELFQLCQDQIHRHLQQAAGTKIVLATHTVPDPGMVLYGHSPAYDYQNAWMGWDDSKQPHPLVTIPNLVLQLCGHTHRACRIERPGRAPLVNVSGQDQPHLFEL